jgi:seryl-tRNA synthetase
MILLQLIQQAPERVVEGLAKRGFADGSVLVDRIREADRLRRERIVALDADRAEMNRISKEIGQLMAQGQREAAEAARQQTQALKARIAEGEEALKTALDEVNALLVQLPNIPHSSVPAGRSADDNLIVRQNSRPRENPHATKPHWEVADTFKLIDFERGTKITGAGFPVYRGKGAALQRALINFFLERAIEAGYEEILPPLLVNEASGYGTGQLPDKEGQMYHCTVDNFYLIPTAEVPVTNLLRDEIIAEEELPVKMCGYTPCFRREAGSYGKDTRGLNRLHQFDKVEIVQIAQPEHSYDILEEMVAHVEGLIESLELPYRVVKLCGGDMGFASALTYDLEVWSMAQQRWLEVSSVSNFETFQTNRLKLRYRTADKRNELAHSLNGSALALPRIVAALLENNQQADGRIRLPYVLAERLGDEYLEPPR